jgi:CubicO group peptidase (beta-lactamase class C family)
LMQNIRRVIDFRVSAVLPCLLMLVPVIVIVPRAIHAQAGLPAVAASAIERVATNMVNNSSIPGVIVAVVQGDSPTYLRAFGRTGMDPATLPLGEDALFRAGAVTELINALAAAALAHAGVMALDAPIGNTIPRLPVELHAVTPAQLLSHTAGLTFQLAVPGRGGADDLGAAARQLTRLDRMTEPGVIYSYSRQGPLLAALAMQTAAGRPYADMVGKAVFEPLRMSSSTLDWGKAREWLITGWARSDAPDSPIQRIDPQPDSAITVPVRGLFTTAPDLARLAAALMNDGVVAGQRLLPPGVTAEVLRPRANIPATSVRVATGLRLGHWMDRPSVSITGAFGGHAVLMHLLLEERIGVVVLSNTSSIYLQGISDNVFRELLGVPAPQPTIRTATEPDGAILAELLVHAGVYRNGGETIEIMVVNGRPMMKSGDMVLELRALDGGAAGAVLRGQVGMTFRLVSDNQGRRYLWVGSRALARVPSSERGPPSHVGGPLVSHRASGLESQFRSRSAGSS